MRRAEDHVMGMLFRQVCEATPEEDALELVRADSREQAS